MKNQFKSDLQKFVFASFAFVFCLLPCAAQAQIFVEIGSCISSSAFPSIPKSPSYQIDIPVDSDGMQGYSATFWRETCASNQNRSLLLVRIAPSTSTVFRNFFPRIIQNGREYSAVGANLLFTLSSIDATGYVYYSPFILNVPAAPTTYVVSSGFIRDAFDPNLAFTITVNPGEQSNIQRSRDIPAWGSSTSLQSQFITFSTLSNRVLGSGAFTVNATATSGQTVTFSTLTPSNCNVNGATVSLLAVGTCTIAANQGGNSVYSEAAQVTQSFSITQATLQSQFITFSTLSNRVLGSGAFTLGATASSGQTLTFSTLTPSNCSVSGTTVSLLAVGTCTIAANQGGNSVYSPATQVTQSFSITSAAQITFLVTPSAGSNGSISPNSVQTVVSGSVASFTISPSVGYAASVAGSCGGSLSGSLYTTNPVNANCTVIATFSSTMSRPVNDNFASRILVTGAPTTVLGTNVGATKEPGEPNHVGQPGGTSVWWTWIAPSSGITSITTVGSNFDTLLAVYTGTSLGTLIERASNDDSSTDVTSIVTFSAVAGQSYQIAVDGYDGASGQISLGISIGAPASGLPDLIIADLTSDFLATPGVSFNKSAKVVNQGTAEAGAFRLTFYLSLDEILDSSDTFTSYCEMPVLPAGQSHSCVGPTPLPASVPPGDYYFFAVAAGSVNERDETNNTRFVRVLVRAASVVAPRNYSDMWWAGQAENGWGMSIQQHGQIQLNALYVYDSAGKPIWYVLPGGSWNSDFTTYSGQIYQPNSAPLNNYSSAQFQVGAPVGNVSINFTSDSTATLSYLINGVSGQKSMQRQVFGRGNAPLTVGDMWWGGTAQNGWGINITQQAGILFGAWYTYGPDGKATWYVITDGTWTGNTYTGTFFSTLGSRWLGTTYSPSQLQVVPVGTLTLNFNDANSGSMTYAFNSGPFAGITQTKQIVRQPY